MYQDEVISEVWKLREEYAKKHGHDLRAIIADLKERQRTPFSRLVDRRNPDQVLPVSTEKPPR